MKFTVIEVDLNKAIKENLAGSDICASCLVSQTLMRELRTDFIRTYATKKYVAFTLNREHYHNDNGSNNEYMIYNEDLVSLMNLFDMRQIEIVRPQLPFIFEFNFPDGVENANSSNSTKS